MRDHFVTALWRRKYSIWTVKKMLVFFYFWQRPVYDFHQSFSRESVSRNKDLSFNFERNPIMRSTVISITKQQTDNKSIALHISNKYTVNNFCKNLKLFPIFHVVCKIKFLGYCVFVFIRKLIKGILFWWNKRFFF